MFNTTTNTEPNPVGELVLSDGDSNTQIRVFLIDDQPIVRTGLKTLLQEEPDLICVGEADGTWEALQLIEESKPNVVVVESELNGVDSLEIAKAIMKNTLDTEVIILTNRGDEFGLVHAMQYEIAGFITRESSKSLIANAIRSIACGGGVWDKQLLRKAIRLLQLPNSVLTDPETGEKLSNAEIINQQLTSKELSTLNLIVEGRTNKDIALKLGVSESSVKGYVTKIMQKLNVSNRTQIALKVTQLSES